VTVHTKRAKSSIDKADWLPENLAGLPVDVREASAYVRLRDIDPLAAQLSEAYARPEDREPDWKYEREMPSGELVTSARSTTQRTMTRQRAVQPHAVAALAAKTNENFIAYQPIGCPALTPLSVTADVTVASSPDAGYGVLSGFLGKTENSLVIGMYDFTSGKLLDDMCTVLGGNKTLQMVLDNPALNDTADQSDWVTIQTLSSKLGGRAKIARALTRGDHFVDHWSFPYAYHIKVIVRDGKGLWISSGNLNNSNEPPPSYNGKKDRDWHIVFENITDAKGADLCTLFAAYLDYDYATASKYQVPSPGIVEKAIEEARQKRQSQANPGSRPAYSSKFPITPSTAAPAINAAPVKARRFPQLTATVTPLLTPDLLPGGEPQYLSTVTSQLKSAKTSIDIQLQYIEASKDATSPYGKLLKTIKDQVGKGVMVRLIVSADYASKWGELMLTQGVDLTASIHTQPAVHNKGFIVDERYVIVSSQNFSPAGVHDNRDGGVLVDSPKLAGYFSPIFDGDWTGSRPLTVKAGTGVKPKVKSAGAKSSKKAGQK